MRLLTALTVGALVAKLVLGETSSLQSEPIEDATPREVSPALSLYTKPRLLEEAEAFNNSSTNAVEEEYHDDEEDHDDEENHGDEEHHDDEDHDHDDHVDEVSSEANVRDDLPWGEAIGAALLINLATLVGLLVSIPMLLTGTLCAGRRGKASPEQIHARHQNFIRNYLPSFGAGALLAAAVFLIIPEAILLLSVNDEHEGHRRYLQEEEHSGENSMAWKFGTSFLGGYVLSLVLGSLFPHVHDEGPKCPVFGKHETLEQTKKNSSCKDEECLDRPPDHYGTSHVFLSFANVSRFVFTLLL
jgi:hypothetical protein